MIRLADSPDCLVVPGKYSFGIVQGACRVDVSCVVAFVPANPYLRRDGTAGTLSVRKFPFLEVTPSSARKAHLFLFPTRLSTCSTRFSQ